jgi:2-dehydro-3-deoxyphosphogluconate aldolase / (4S)-4-hydroxy-2-oxoglutarate aldolase
MTVLDRLAELVVVAVMRAPDHGSAMGGAAALVEGGVRAIEVTYSTPQAARVVRDLRQEYGESVLVGAGTVTTPAQVVESVDAGAEFLVSPGCSATVAAAMRESGKPVALGVLTPTELMAALDLGADLVKLFPGSLGGPGYLQALRGPFPDVPLMPTGGVSVDNARAWLAAGAFCLGVGGDLVPPALLAAADHEEITRRARAFIDAVGGAQR